MFDRWCASMKEKTFEELHELILLEEFKKCVAEQVATYLNEQKVLKCSAAAASTDGYVLTRKTVFNLTQNVSSSFRHRSPKRNFDSALPSDKAADSSGKTSSLVCFYCKKRGHIIARNALKNKKVSLNQWVYC